MWSVVLNRAVEGHCRTPVLGGHENSECRRARVVTEGGRGSCVGGGRREAADLPGEEAREVDCDEIVVLRPYGLQADGQTRE